MGDGTARVFKRGDPVVFTEDGTAAELQAVITHVWPGDGLVADLVVLHQGALKVLSRVPYGSKVAT